MHIAEEVRKVAKRLRGLFGQHELREMLLAYADLLEAMEWFNDGCDGDSFAVKMIRTRADEKQKARKG